MKIDINEARRLAGLSALEFTEAELEAFIPDFEKAIAFVDKVTKCDVGQTKFVHTAHPLSQLREDAAKESLPQEEILTNSPKTKRGSFCVPKMLD